MTMQQLSLFDEPRYTGSQHDELARAAADAFTASFGVAVQPAFNVTYADTILCAVPHCHEGAFITIPVGTRWGTHLCLGHFDAIE